MRLLGVRAHLAMVASYGGENTAIFVVLLNQGICGASENNP